MIGQTCEGTNAIGRAPWRAAEQEQHDRWLQDWRQQQQWQREWQQELEMQLTTLEQRLQTQEAASKKVTHPAITPTPFRTLTE